MTLNAIVQDANQDEVTGSLNFTVYIKPVASNFEILTKDVKFQTNKNISLDLNVDLYDNRGTDPGETPEEIVTLNFTNVPTSTFLLPLSGGRLSNPSPGIWLFTGTQRQVADGQLQIVNVNQTVGTYYVSVRGVTKDGADVSAAVTDDFPFQVVVASLAQGGSFSATGATTIGTANNDVMRATATGQTLSGGGGIDMIYSSTGTIMTGGAESDIFVIPSFPVTINQITDFTAGTNGDVLNVGALVNPAFNQQIGQISQVARLQGTFPARKIQVYDGSTWKDVATITNLLDSATVEMLWSNGNLLV
jgi:hypothetical protein